VVAATAATTAATAATAAPTAASSDDPRLLTTQLARSQTAAELRAHLESAVGSGLILNATHAAAALAVCARQASGGGKSGEGEAAAAAARRLGHALLSRLDVVAVDSADARDPQYGVVLVLSDTEKPPQPSPISLRDAASLLASTVALLPGRGRAARRAASTTATATTAASALFMAAACAADDSSDDRSAESVALALAAAARLGLPAPPTPLHHLLLSRAGHAETWPPRAAAQALRALSELLPRWQREQGHRLRLRRQKRAAAAAPAPASADDATALVSLPPGCLDGALRATLPLLEQAAGRGSAEEEDEVETEDDNHAPADLASLLIAATRLAPLAPPTDLERAQHRRRRGANRAHPPSHPLDGQGGSTAQQQWPCAWLLAAERTLPDASAARLTRTFSALAISGALEAWPVEEEQAAGAADPPPGADEDEEDKEEEEDESGDNNSSPPLLLRRRQRRFLRAAYGQLYYTADQFSPLQLGELLSGALVCLAKGSAAAAARGRRGSRSPRARHHHPPLPLAERLAAYAVAKAAMVARSTERDHGNELRDAMAGAGRALKGLAEVHRLRRRRRKGKPPPSSSSPPPPPDARLLAAAREAVLVRGLEALDDDDDDDDDDHQLGMALALIDLLDGLAAIGPRLSQRGGEGGEEEEDDDDAPHHNPETAARALALLARSGSRLSPAQLATMLNAMTDLGPLLLPTLPLEAHTPQSAWARALLRASALRLRACRDPVAVSRVAEAVARLCAPGRSWTLRTLLPTAALVAPRLERRGGGDDDDESASRRLLRALAMLLPPIVDGEEQPAPPAVRPADAERLVAQLQSAVKEERSDKDLVEQELRVVEEALKVLCGADLV